MNDGRIERKRFVSLCCVHHLIAEVQIQVLNMGVYIPDLFSFFFCPFFIYSIFFIPLSLSFQNPYHFLYLIPGFNSYNY